ncbi:MAG: PCRF domain-containing protein, partial [Clostridia bacterium]|nr:PCRF domain-containing protein [Clostridia bacterium]
MFQKLDIFEKRYEELNNKLYDPAVATNAELYNDIMKEVKSLEPIVEKYREYKTAVQTLEDAKQIIAEGTDDEFKAMLDEEIA